MLKLFKMFFVSAFSIILISGCGSEINVDEPLTPHFVMDGFGLYDSSNKLLVKVLDNQFVEGTLGQIQVKNGAQVKNFKVRFFDSTGAEINKPSADYQVFLDVNDNTTAQVTLEDNQSMQYTLTGLKPGETKLRLLVAHGGHYDYLSPNVQIVVNE